MKRNIDQKSYYVVLKMFIISNVKLKFKEVKFVLKGAQIVTKLAEFT